MAEILFISTPLSPAGPPIDQPIAFKVNNNLDILSIGISIRYLRDPHTYVIFETDVFTRSYEALSTASNLGTTSVSFDIFEFGGWRGEILAIEVFGIDALGTKFVVPAWDHRIPFVQLPAAPTFAVPRSAADYTDIGFPAPTYIWDMQASGRPIPELIAGSANLADDTGGSTGLVYEVATALPNGETSIQRTTVNTSRQKLIDTTLLDVGADKAVAIGMMFKVSGVGGTNVLAAKRPTNGYDCRLNVTGRMWMVTSDGVSSISLAGDAATELAIGVWHYGIFVFDHRTGFKELKIIDEFREKTVSSATLGDLSATNGFGWDTSSLLAAQNKYAAMAAWTGSDVQLLTATLAQAFLTKAGA